ncbi:hypothetical protein I3249_02400 [Psychrobacter sp. Ps1]|uniref:TubC N-terminal docking domain-related protein n=1 Tax=Psychrobacter sp. Ps1 TaxID=2790955 RepID=UPI001EDD9296|nr:hypothetical protein [Psychrobacter sp. Ps1]MCG3841627.1 hypothetical protein [Psychrobacter sp. Ps1]
MNAIDIISQLEYQGVSLWVDDDGLHYEGDINIVTPSVINALREYKPEIIEVLSQSAANDEPLPTRWSVALSVIDDMIAEKRSQLLYAKAPVSIQRRDWRKRYQMVLSLNDWETERLEQDLRANKWVYFNNMFETVERTTPEFEIAADKFINWAETKGIGGQFLWVPTGVINHGRMRELPADTIQGLNDYMLSH